MLYDIMLNVLDRVHLRILYLEFIYSDELYLENINVSVQYNGGLLPDIILSTRCNYIGEPF